MDLPELTDGTVVLRSLMPEHVSDVYVSWLNDPEVVRFTEVRHTCHDLNSTREYVRDAVKASDTALWQICVDNFHVGNIRLSGIDQTHLRADIAILIGVAPCRGKGIGTRSITLVTGYAFSTLGLEKLSAGIYAENIASLKAFEKAGYRKGAVLSRHAIFEGYRTDVIQMTRFLDDLEAEGV